MIFQAINIYKPPLTSGICQRLAPCQNFEVLKPLSNVTEIPMKPQVYWPYNSFPIILGSHQVALKKTTSQVHDGEIVELCRNIWKYISVSPTCDCHDVPGSSHFSSEIGATRITRPCNSILSHLGNRWVANNDNT
jgi:hypothetical protein